MVRAAMIGRPVTDVTLPEENFPFGKGNSLDRHIVERRWHVYTDVLAAA